MTDSNVAKKKKRFLRAVQDNAKYINNQMFADMYQSAVARQLAGDPILFNFLAALERMPVSPETFLDSEEFIGATDLVVWPEVRKAFVEINCNWWKGKEGGAYDEAVMMGATGTAKSTIAMLSIMYHLHILSCIKKPQTLYGLPEQTSIVFPLMGAKPHVVNKVVYAPMRKFIEAMPYFQKHMMPNKLIDSEMMFTERNVRVVKAGGDEDAILGEAIIGGMIDEINFMAVIARSKKAEVSTGRAGLYDQAQQVHHRMMTRKEGRFQRPDNFPMIGIIFPSSSTRYKNDFTDKRKAFVERTCRRSTYIYNKRQYEVVPQERFCGKTFRLIIGNDVCHDTRVLRDDEVAPVGAWVEDVPIEYRNSFENKPFDTLRDVLGISHNALSPFIKSRHKIIACVEAGTEYGLESLLVNDHVILGTHGMLQVRPNTYCTNPFRPRYVHIDLSRSQDRCGIAMVRFEGLRAVSRGSPGNETTEMLPVGVVEMSATIEPDASNEIQISEVRAFVKQLKTRYGYPIKAVTYDGFDSRESIQEWRRMGMKSSMISVDRSSTPYKQLRDAMYDGRVYLPDDEILLEEIFGLEYDEDKDEIDHPVSGSKDASDAVCGAYTSMLERKATWAAAASDDRSLEMAGRYVDDERYDEPRPI